MDLIISRIIMADKINLLWEEKKLQILNGINEFVTSGNRPTLTQLKEGRMDDPDNENRRPFVTNARDLLKAEEGMIAYCIRRGLLEIFDNGTALGRNQRPEGQAHVLRDGDRQEDEYGINLTSGKPPRNARYEVGRAGQNFLNFHHTRTDDLDIVRFIHNTKSDLAMMSDMEPEERLAWQKDHMTIFSVDDEDE